MINWERTDKELGNVFENTSHEIIFKMKGDKAIAKNAIGAYKITTSCGCSDAVWNEKSKVLKVNYNAGEIPVHLSSQGQKAMTTTKYVTITYSDDTTEKLSFTATINSRKL